MIYHKIYLKPSPILSSHINCYTYECLVVYICTSKKKESLPRSQCLSPSPSLFLALSLSPLLFLSVINRRMPAVELQAIAHAFNPGLDLYYVIQLCSLIVQNGICLCVVLRGLILCSFELIFENLNQFPEFLDLFFEVVREILDVSRERWLNADEIVILFHNRHLFHVSDYTVPAPCLYLVQNLAFTDDHDWNNFPNERRLRSLILRPDV